ncbi:hypothetical protein L915_20246 [Plasmopara halstedii]|uniref:FYVE-type domain-containing protein n=1 Tax=Plasmopara halstedii TaxID=4781 RepID=A0A0P1B255_PLAHL|nr:hypothetical protein L915_20246 [Plasmopara halstedii]CEG48306.1 hypothetical protein L915_20246 [Plasmopara halstedii]|eukprot:XP_024584675.1 hypothetical protein L915_20246 [Plasmopara halstedii]
MSRVLNTSSKQKALVQLISSDPSLLSGLDDELLASITLSSNPPTQWLEQQSTLMTRKCNQSIGVPTVRETIQLYPEDAPFVEKKKPSNLPRSLRAANKLSAPRATTVLLSPSSTAIALAATYRSKQNLGSSTHKISSNNCSTTKDANYPAIQREQPASVILFDASMLNAADGNTNAVKSPHERKKKSKRMRRLGKTRSSSENDSSTDSENDLKYKKADKTVWGTSSLIRCSGSFESESDEGIQAVGTITSSATCDGGVASRLLLDHHFVPRDRRILVSAQKACYVCMREFSVLRKRHSCRMCGQVICRRCSVVRQVRTPLMEDKLRLCTCCFVACRRQQEGEISQSHCNNEASTSESANDGNFGYLERSIITSKLDLPVSSASGSGFFQAPSPSDNTSNRSSSTLNNMSDFSFSSDTISDARIIEEELEAILKAKALEKEVEASQERILALEAQIATQESQQDLLSIEQQAELHDARATIKSLHEKLCTQEANARQAAFDRDSICLNKLRQTEVYANEDDESDALKKKLRVLERQLQQAGISVAEVIPYDVAKKKVAEISKRLQEIGSSEVVLEDKHAQAAARKEYYVLEQEMEKYHMALVMSDEYIEEQQRQEQEWEDANYTENIKALHLLRSAIPVNIARLSERELIKIVTPTGSKFPPELARRLKRTNVLQLLRTSPTTIAKMHPSVIEGYRTTGLSLLERRALHAVMIEPSRGWKKQQRDDLAQRKYAWLCKLKESFMTAAKYLTNHLHDDVGSNHTIIRSEHHCDLASSICPVRTEERMQKLYSGLGFTTNAEYMTEDIVKSDPEGAGEKALLEAQDYVQNIAPIQRQKILKVHYKTNMREFAQALSALEEMDSLLAQLRSLDDSFPLETSGRQQLNQCVLLLNTARELMQLHAKRAGICVTGKRDFAKDKEDIRSPAEIREACRAVIFLQEILGDVEALLSQKDVRGEHETLIAAATLKSLRELINDVRQKNLTTLNDADKINAASERSRVPWVKRRKVNTPTNQCTLSNDQTSNNSFTAAIPTSASVFNAIKARRKQRESIICSHSNQNQLSTETSRVNKSLDLMAAIRAQKRAMSTEPIEE